MLLGSIGDRLGAGFTFGMCLILDCVVMVTSIFITLIYHNTLELFFCISGLKKKTPNVQSDVNVSGFLLGIYESIIFSR